ncbi:MAG TPA: NAD(P)-dependent oxidoreductase [bacterium]|nr:NAD(P)-dependent oxidoreductase [bacterium]
MAQTGKVIVTGGAGRTGRIVVAHLLESGFDVTSVDIVPWPNAPCPHAVADLQDYGECIEVFSGRTAAVHLAGVWAPGVRTPQATYAVNMLSTYNVFSAAARLGLTRVVWASTCAVSGGPFGPEMAPARFPLVETDDVSVSTTYALSKALGETIASQRRLWGGLSLLALRFAWIFHPDEYGKIPGYWPDLRMRMFNLWGYLDVRDAAQACRRALEADLQGSETFFVTAADTVMDRPTRHLVTECFPGARLAETDSEFGTLYSVDKARRLLGYQPDHSWRQHVTRR